MLAEHVLKLFELEQSKSVYGETTSGEVPIQCFILKGDRDQLWRVFIHDWKQF